MGKLVGFVRSIRTVDATKGKTCLFPFSVGQPYHEKDKLTAAMQFGFDYFASENCFAVCCDTLQAETKFIGKSAEDYQKCLDEARKEGEEFLQRNHEALSIVGAKHQDWITRWDDWTNLPEYRKKQELTEQMHRQDKRFGECVDKTARQFLRSMDTVSPDAYEKSVRYIKFECAVALLWADKMKPNFVIYPMEINGAMEYTFNKIREITGNKEIMIPLRLSFITKPDHKVNQTTTKSTKRQELSGNVPSKFFTPSLPSQLPLLEIEPYFSKAEAILKQMKADLLALRAAYNAAFLEGEIEKSHRLKREIITLSSILGDINTYLSESSSSGEDSPEHSPRESKASSSSTAVSSTIVNSTGT